MDRQKLPVINFAPENLKHGTEKWYSTCKDVMKALEEYGCFMAIYDRIPLKVRDSIISALDQLFDLPRETKMKNTASKPFFGYFGDDSELPLYEGMGIEDATNIKAIKKFCEQFMWPNADGNEEFCGIIHRYVDLLSPLEEMVITMVFESYGLGKLCESHIDSTTFLIRFNSYRVSRLNETAVGAQPHTDKSFLTILDQNQVGGLEVKLKDEQWYAVDFLPSSFVVMAGEGLLAWSNNRIRTPVHQVTMNGKVPRYSIALFSYHKGIIHIPEELIDEEHPQRFKPFDHLGLLNFFDTQYKEGGMSHCSIYSYCGV